MSDDISKSSVDRNFGQFVYSEVEKLREVFGFKDISEILRKEEVDWERIWRENAQGALAMYREERLRRQMMVELLWAVLHKLGGEVRLGLSDLAPLDWEFVETFDPLTGEKVLKSRIRKVETL